MHHDVLATTRHPATTSAAAQSPPVVLLHGLAGTQSVWRRTVGPLRDVAEVITVDLPGFGRSPLPRGRWTLDGAASMLDATLEHHGVSRCVVVGHSLGGGVAIHAAVACPRRIVGLGLVAPAGFGGHGRDVPPTQRAERLHRVWRATLPATATTLFVSPKLRNRIFSMLVHDPSSLTAREAVELARGAARGRSTLEARSAIVAADLFDELRRIVVPASVVWGRDDRVVGSQTARLLGEQLRDVRTTILDDVGHNPQLERPDVVVEALADLVRRSVAHAGRARTSRSA